jgi:predicted Fe-Mo cluster-binding NifX family protein
MKIVISATGDTLDAPTSPVFGRCPTYLFVDSETMQFEAVANPAMAQGGGAGIQAAQFVVERGAQAVLTGNLGPNAFDVLEAAGVSGYLVPQGTIRQAVEAFKAGQTQPMGRANVAAHAGMGGGASLGAGRGMGRGMGRRVGMGGGSRPTAPSQPAPDATRESELAQLRETLRGLRRQLAETMERIEQLENEG